LVLLKEYITMHGHLNVKFVIRRYFLHSGPEYCCMVSSRFWRDVLLGCYFQFYRLVDVPVSARNIEPNAGIQSSL